MEELSDVIGGLYKLIIDFVSHTISSNIAILTKEYVCAGQVDIKWDIKQPFVKNETLIQIWPE